MDNKNNKIVTPREKFTKQDREYINTAIGYITANMRTYLSILKKRAGDITSRELSRCTGISPAVISDLENNKYLPKMEVLLKLSYGMNSHFFALFNHMWSSEDASNWAKLTKTPYPKPEINTDFVSIFNPSEDVPTLKQILSKEGLSAKDIKEILDFIEFKKFNRKKNKLK